MSDTAEAIFEHGLPRGSATREGKPRPDPSLSRFERIFRNAVEDLRACVTPAHMTYRAALASLVLDARRGCSSVSGDDGVDANADASEDELTPRSFRS